MSLNGSLRVGRENTARSVITMSTTLVPVSGNSQRVLNVARPLGSVHRLARKIEQPCQHPEGLVQRVPLPAGHVEHPARDIFSRRAIASRFAETALAT